jgi:hypothetical protein
MSTTVRTHGHLGLDDLRGAAAFAREACAQRLVAACDGGERALEGAQIRLARDADGGGHVVERVVGLELIEEPQALLGEGERQRALPRCPRDGRDLEAVARADGDLDLLGEARDGGPLEQALERQIHRQRFADARHDLRREQRVTAELEEAVVDARLRHVQQIGPDARDDLLHGATRRGVRGLHPRAPLGGGQRLAIELARRGDGHGGQLEDRLRHHVFGQALLEMRAQLAHRRRRRARGHEVAHEALVARVILAGDHDHLAHARVGREHALDLLDLDAITADLHLLIDAPEELDGAVATETTEVARAVQATFAEGAGDEARGRLLGQVEVARSDARAADDDLAGHPHGHGREALVEQVDARVGDGAADGYATPRVARAEVRRDAPHAGLGGAVFVVEPGARQTRVVARDEVGQHRFARHDGRAQAVESARLRLAQQHAVQRRHGEQVAHRAVADEGHDRPRIVGDPFPR